MKIQKRYISSKRDVWYPNVTVGWLFYGYYNRDLRRRKLANPSISLFPYFFIKKEYVLNVKEAVEM